ncbi:MAG: hypothetical protein NC489_33905 [Ruminococcus flavefaciens]|nr:hypothetical protein [Ruminococcus flavefaciens]
MKKKNKIITAAIIVAIIVIGVVVALFATHILCIHKWIEADCLNPKTCSRCEKTEGEPLGHDFSKLTCVDDEVCLRCGETGQKAEGHKWNDAKCTEDEICLVCGEIGRKATEHKWLDATCTEPKTCSVCKETDGKAKGHKWDKATCVEPKTCSVCGKNEGKANGHKWIEANVYEPKTCSVCGETEGEKLKSYDIYFSINDIISASGILQSEWGLYEISGLSCDNGTANANIEAVGSNVTVNNVLGVNVSYAASGTVTISGTIKSMHIVTRENIGIVNAFDTDSKYFSVTKTVGEN